MEVRSEMTNWLTHRFLLLIAYASISLVNAHTDLFSEVEV